MMATPSLYRCTCGFEADIAASMIIHPKYSASLVPPNVSHQVTARLGSPALSKAEIEEAMKSGIESFLYRSNDIEYLIPIGDWHSPTLPPTDYALAPPLTDPDIRLAMGRLKRGERPILVDPLTDPNDDFYRSPSER